jgi:hypothetical protein
MEAGMPELGGYVYAIGIEGTTLVKIGRAAPVERRLREKGSITKAEQRWLWHDMAAHTLDSVAGE